MTVENALNSKTYYKQFVIENPTNNPLKALAEMQMIGQKDELLTTDEELRFSQGELYFHYKDFEAAIFKWENIYGELEQWAEKNKADAYYELGQLVYAENIYKSIHSDNLILNTEVELNLFYIYVEKGYLDMATKVVKNVISLNPDHPNVTTIACSFFERYQDWENAIDLAVNEALRTNSIEWYERLKIYIDEGNAKRIAPDYFTKILQALYSIDQLLFVDLSKSLWKTYKPDQQYLSWVKVFNDHFQQVDTSDFKSCGELSNLFQWTYTELFRKNYSIKQLSDIVPTLLLHWMEVKDTSDSVVVSAAVISWSEFFPSSIDSSVVNEAEEIFYYSENVYNVLGESLDLFESIAKWTNRNGLDEEDSKPLDDLTEFATSLLTRGDHREENSEKLLYYIRQSLEHLYSKRVELENRLVNSIALNEEITSKLNGAVHQLHDIENEISESLTTSFFIIRDEMKENLNEVIPTLLRECSNVIDENSNLGNIHKVLNKEMNEVVRSYIQQTILPKFSKEIHEWVKVAEQEFTESQTYLDELFEGFNTLNEENKLTLTCDFQVLNDWIRDADRMTNVVEIDSVSILTGFNPTVLLLKNSGKLIGYLRTNKVNLYKLYRRFIEKGNYDEVVASISSQFMMPFELFEKSITREVNMFFREPFNVLKEAILDCEQMIETDKESLNILKTNPEVYFDPLILFEIRTRQYELMLPAEKNTVPKV
ncbi:hypothetical protein [Gracilibacillus sp. YIM 98692]|uniref:tetratricopeptide repeat protein n=1 Tax=Gracilibacillus sp. YIM 98692 TaxID=2663532 RepID=UPI0013D6B9C5|nr:hypothetical protein [Gracilibacillus sp. YIM 98692]